MEKSKVFQKLFVIKFDENAPKSSFMQYNGDPQFLGR